MKTYIKPSIEEIAVGAKYHIVESTLPVGNEPGDAQGAPGRKGSLDDDWEDEEDTGFGW